MFRTAAGSARRRAQSTAASHPRPARGSAAAPLLVQRSRERANVTAQRIAQRVPDAGDGGVDAARRSEVDTLHRGVAPNHVGGIARLAVRRVVGRGRRVERLVDDELDEGARRRQRGAEIWPPSSPAFRRGTTRYGG